MISLAFADDEIVDTAEFDYPRDDDAEFKAAMFREASTMTRDAVSFVIGIVSQSRTGRSALLKLATIDSLLGGPESSHEIARRFHVSPRMVQRVMKETRKEFFGRKFASRS